MPPAVMVPQTVPFIAHCVAPGAETAVPQVPSVAPAGFVQLPPQQSAFVAHASPVCTQNEMPAEQSEPLHRPEQQSVLFAQGLPDVLHVVDSGEQVPLLHAPLQHWPATVHA